MKTRITDLGGDYSVDDQFLDLWTGVGTMKGKEFSGYVKQSEDDESAKEKSTRNSINEVIRKIGAKQTRMETKNEWNMLSQEDSMIMTLTDMVSSHQKSF